MSRLLMSGARIICPFTGLDGTGDVLVEDGRIALVRVGGGIEVDAERIDCSGLVLSPGFVDLHTHLREPGEEHKETLTTGAAAALAGGYTTICVMPNTAPAMDNPMVIADVLRRSAALSVRVLPIGAVTLGRAGHQLAPLWSLTDAGVVGFSDDGNPVADAALMKRAMEYARAVGLPVISHAEEPALSRNGEMHEGAVSGRLGLPGIPASAETVMVQRDLTLAEETGAHLHVAHISTAGAVRAVRAARERGVHVTAEVTPHHLVLTDDWVAGWGTLHGEPARDRVLGERAYDTATKVNPPLRSSEHVDAVVEGVLEGTITAIATDHAPHSVLEKDCTYAEAAFGISGLETAFGLVMTLVHAGRVPLPTLLRLLTLGPARAFGIEARGIEEGARAELALLDLDAEWTVDPEAFYSMGHNTPLGGCKLRGRVMMTVSGESGYRARELEVRCLTGRS